MNCELCDLVNGNLITRWYYEDDSILIVDCTTCGVPMLVFKHHGDITQKEQKKAEEIINSLFSHTGIRRLPRKILDHSHWHLEGAKFKEDKHHF